MRSPTLYKRQEETKNNRYRVDDDDEEEFVEDDDEESAFGFEDIAQFDPDNKDRRKQLEMMARIDEEYEGEWGYGLVKALRGKTVGRRLRRKLFKYGAFQLFCGFPLFMIAIQETQNLQNVSNFTAPLFGGASLTNLTWCVGFPIFLWGIASMAIVRHWASLVTNRKLLSNIMRIYLGIGILEFILSLWCTCVLFLTYRTVKDWNVSIKSFLYTFYV
jgi:hypothetical protein